MEPEELKEVLRLHAMWLADTSTGAKANLCGANLSGVNLSGVNLRGVNLRWADLRRADLRRADLCEADLRRADLCEADLRGASLRGANLSEANLRGADLRRATLCGANLRRAGLSPFQICPEEGDFVAWKKVEHNCVLKLLVTGKRTSSLVGRKCRTDAAKVLAAYDRNGEIPGGGTYQSRHNSKFKYTVGEASKETSYDPDIRVECTAGIHFFMTRQEAEEY